MDRFFGLPVPLVAGVLAALVGLLLGGFALLGWRQALLVKLGARNIPRRRVRAALIVFGLTLSTTVIGSAIGTGDTITYTLRSLVTESLGTVDEIVVREPPRISNTERIRALTEGSFGGVPADRLGWFPPGEYARIREAVRDSAAIAAVAPAIADQVTVVHGDTQQLQTAVALLAIGTPDPAFGPLVATDGTPLRLEALADDEVVLNAAAAGLFGADAGATLQIRAAGGPPDGWPVRVAAIARNGGIGGVQPLIVAPLPRYGRLLGRADYNQLLVANRGGIASVARTAAASSELRALLVNRAAAAQVRQYLARPETQRALVEVEGTLEGRDRDRLAALRAEALQPQLTDRFVSLVSEPRARQQLLFLARGIPNRSERGAAFASLRDLAPLSVIEIKREGFDQADEYGSVVTTVFLVLGIFSIAASIMLIYLIFALLAADRGAELATMRALGMRRRQIMALFLVEGLVYDLTAAALGALGGVAATALTVNSLAGSLQAFGLRLQPHLDARGPLIAFAIGVLVTFATMLLAAWRVSRVEIVAATRGEAVDESRAGLLVLGLGLALAAAAVWWRWREPALFYLPRHPLVLPGALTLAILGATCSLLALPHWRTARRGDSLAGGLATAAGAAIILLWTRALTGLPTPRGATRADALTAAAGGLVLIVAAVWTATRALGPALRGLDRALGDVAPLARLRATVRPAAGYLGVQRWRTGLAVTMFGMVVFIMVASLTLIDVLVNAYADREAPVAGYELRADLRTAAAGALPLTDIEAALREAPAVSRETFGAVGGLATQNVQLIQFGPPRAAWAAAPLVVADDGFLGGIAARIDRRAPGYDSDAAVWRALRERPGTAVATVSTLNSVLSLPPAAAGERFAPVTAWVRAPDGGRPVRLQIVGIVDARSDLDGGIYTSRATAEGLGVALPAPTTYFFAVAPGGRTRDAAEGLRVSFNDRGLVVTDLGDTLRIGQSVRALLTQLVQGFMGLGLIAGIAALGILGVQSVIERRQQLGTLRALGFTRGQMRATLAFESATIALLGIALGTVLGLLLARSLVALLAAGNPEIRYAVPWDQIALTTLMAWLGALGALAIAALQAGRVSPADALRAA